MNTNTGTKTLNNMTLKRLSAEDDEMWKQILLRAVDFACILPEGTQYSIH